MPTNPFTDNPPPISVIYSLMWVNVSNQVLELSTQLFPGEVWSQLFAERYLSQQEYTNRSYVVQNFINLGYISKARYAPVIGVGQFFMQSSGGLWFEVDAAEFDQSPTDNTENDVTYVTTLVSGPPAGSVINFDIQIDSGTPLILQLDNHFCVGLYIEARLLPSPYMIFEKRDLLNYPILTNPLSIPYTQNLIFLDVNNVAYRYVVDDSGGFILSLM